MTCIFRGRRSTLDVSIFILRGRCSTSDAWCCCFCESHCQGCVKWRHAWDTVRVSISVADVCGISFACDTPHSTLHILQFSLFTFHVTIHSLHCTLHSALCTLHTAHCTLYTVHFMLHALHFTIHTRHLTLHTIHVTLHARTLQHSNAATL